ncbi:MAG: erythromycin esterase family protein [Pseudomonadota bacterium]
MPSPDQHAAAAITASALPLRGEASDYDALLAAIDGAQVVLLGEATHGSHEFYAERARLTQRLILEQGFTAVAVEADWPDAYRVNRFVRAEGKDRDAASALSGFQRFPSWMWRNTDVLDLVRWLRTHNHALPASEHAGFYGLDLYSLYGSIGEVLRYLEQVDPPAAREARRRYACFDHYDEDSQAYGMAAGIGMSDSCERDVLTQLQQLQQRAADYAAQGGPGAVDELFHAQQNARLVINAERYYRTMFQGRVSSWNLRDSHMADTLDGLIAHLTSRSGRAAKIVVWEHNSHIGDARATESARLGEWNVGQLVRERMDGKAFLIGYTTYEGNVTAASDWDGVAEHKRVLAALPESHEALLHASGIGNFYLPLRGASAAAGLFSERRLERAIGVIYRPATERQSHYFHARLAQQFDAVVHIDTTTAVTPLDPAGGEHAGEPPETYPAGV